MSMSAQQGRARDQGTLVVAVANPHTLPHLMHLASRMAAVGNYRVVATHVVTVRPQISLLSARGSDETLQAKELLMQAMRAGAALGCPVRSVVQVAREVHEGIISAVQSQQADALLLGYSEVEEASARGAKAFDRIMHRVARATTVDLVVARFRRKHMHTLLVPVATGVNLPLASLVTRALATDGQAAVTFVHMVRPEEDLDEARQRIEKLLAEHGLAELGELQVKPAEEPLKAVLEMVESYDVCLVGTEPRAGLREHVFGTWAERLASQASTTVLLVRAARR